MDHLSSSFSAALNRWSVVSTKPPPPNSKTGFLLADRYGYVKNHKKTVKNGQKRTRERMSDQEAKKIEAEAREIMPQPSTVNCS
ncbi:hypothetical protein Tco_0847164 [Tanacetum coccineum]